MSHKNEKRDRFVFAVIYDEDGNKILFSQFTDGRGWDLPGCPVQPGEDDAAALKRGIRAITGLDVSAIRKIGPDHILETELENGIGAVYQCHPEDGTCVGTELAIEHRYMRKLEVLQRCFFVPQETPGEGAATQDAAEHEVPFEFLGDEGPLTAKGRMAFDGFSLMQRPFDELYKGKDEDRNNLDIILIDDDTRLAEKGMGLRIWSRLDPYSPMGIVPPKQMAAAE